MKKKKITAKLYTVRKFTHPLLRASSSLTNGCLYSEGQYNTKITKDDLPEWFVEGIIYKTYGYISAKGVKSLRYQPFFLNHLYRDDCLYISYDKEITGSGFHACYDNYDHFLSGHMILSFLDAVKKYSPEIDVSRIEEELAEKKKWYYDKYPDEAKMGMF